MKWEYKVIKLDPEEKLFSSGGVFDEKALEALLNQAGNESWELVSTVGAAQELGQTRQLIAVFKRPAENQPGQSDTLP